MNEKITKLVSKSQVILEQIEALEEGEKKEKFVSLLGVVNAKIEEAKKELKGEKVDFVPVSERVIFEEEEKVEEPKEEEEKVEEPKEEEEKEKVEEAKKEKVKFKVGDFIKKKKDGEMSEVEIISIIEHPLGDGAKVYWDFGDQYSTYTADYINKEWELAESLVTEAKKEKEEEEKEEPKKEEPKKEEPKKEEPKEEVEGEADDEAMEEGGHEEDEKKAKKKAIKEAIRKRIASKKALKEGKKTRKVSRKDVNERLVGKYFFDTRYNEPFVVVYTDGNDIGIEYDSGKSEKVSKKEFDYKVKMGAWNQWKQPRVESKKATRKATKKVSLKERLQQIKESKRTPKVSEDGKGGVGTILKYETQAGMITTYYVVDRIEKGKNESYDKYILKVLKSNFRNGKLGKVGSEESWDRSRYFGYLRSGALEIVNSIDEKKATRKATKKASLRERLQQIKESKRTPKVSRKSPKKLTIRERFELKNKKK